MTRERYIEYLIATQGNYTCTHLADHLTTESGTSTISHDAISDFLRERKMTPRSLWERVAPLLADSEDSYLLVDDSVQNKQYSAKIEMARLQYSGAEHGLVRGIGIVNLVHSSGMDGDFHPIDYRLFDPERDGKTKHDHFREMLVRAKSDKGIKARTVLFDSWYAASETLKFIHRLDLYFLTTLKSNRMVSLNKEGGYVHLQDIEWTADRLRHGISVKLRELAFRVLLFKVVAENGDIDWVVTNRQADSHPGLLTTDEVQRQNAVRWQIEQMHREIKQLVGSEKCQCRKARSQRNHLAYCYHAWLTLKINARQMGKTLYALQASLFSDYLKAELRNPRIRATCLA